MSLLDDASLYAVPPMHTVDAGASVASVEVLLSANRPIRLIVNSPARMAYDSWRRRPLFVPALFIGGCSTAIYVLTWAFWPLLVGRLLWGLAWAGIWVGGNTIILEIARDDNRDRCAARPMQRPVPLKKGHEDILKTRKGGQVIREFVYRRSCRGPVKLVILE